VLEARRVDRSLRAGTGSWPGVILFAWVWLCWRWMGRGFLSSRRPAAFRSCFGVGMFFSLMGAFSQCVSEWAFRQTSLLFLLHILLGALAAVYPRPSRQSWLGGSCEGRERV